MTANLRAIGCLACRKHCLSITIVFVTAFVVFLQLDTHDWKSVKYVEGQRPAPLQNAKETEKLTEGRQTIPELPKQVEVNLNVHASETKSTTSSILGGHKTLPDPDTPSWLRSSAQVSRKNEKIMRCKGEDMGFFTMFKRQGSLGKMSLDLCLHTCFVRKIAYAGFAGDGSCYCKAGLADFVQHGTSDIARSADMAVKETPTKKTRIFMKAADCQKDFTPDSIKSALIGCIQPPNELTDRMISLTMPDMSPQQCILHCEDKKYILAMHVKKFKSCICSDLVPMFKSATIMQRIIKSCPYESEEELAQGSDLAFIYKTFANDDICGPKRFLKENQGQPIALTSYPGSGNTWIRHLMETTTGIYTGSIYNDMALFRGGLLGEIMPPFSKRTIAIKDHFNKLIDPRYTTAISLVRNIHNATMANFERTRTRSHTAHTDRDAYMSEDFKNFSPLAPKRWHRYQKHVFGNISSVIVVYFENLIRDPVTEMRRIVEFLPSSLVDSHGPALEGRLMCMNLDLEGNFRRPPRKLGFDPFNDETMKTRYSEAIRAMNDLMIENGQPPLPGSYYSG